MLEKEEISPEPLVIRGHHLENLHGFYYWYYWGYDTTIERFVTQTADNIVNLYNDPVYAKDVLGETPEDLARFKGQAEKVIRQFVELPDDHPLELVAGIPDQICEGCAIGNHCHTRFHGDDNWDIVSEDRKWISWLLDYAPYYSEKVDISVQEETVNFTDQPPVTLQRVRTTVGAIRNAMRYFVNV